MKAVRLRRLGALVPLAMTVACGSQPIAPGDQLVGRLESAHFVYLHAIGDGVDTVFQERHFAWATRKLELVPDGKLVYHKYRDRAHLERLTGHRTNGFAEPRTYRFHTIWPLDNHEYVHALFTTLVGEPPALFNEGVAVAHHGASVEGEFDGEPLWNGESVHDLARRFRAQGTLPGLSDLVSSRRFRELDDRITYPVAGSFVRFLIDEGGIDAFKHFAAGTDADGDAATVEADFRKAYGESLPAWWERWRAFLDSPSSTAAARSSPLVRGPRAVSPSFVGPPTP